MITKNINSNISDARLLFYFGLVIFVYMLCSTFFIQLYAIPVLIPSSNLGNGLAMYDAVGFDEIAKVKANDIHEWGWQAWELRPSGDSGIGHSPAGIASIFYALWIEKPYAMLPFNAFVHALTGCLVVCILRRYYSRLASILGAGLFVLNPAAMEWAAQIHRDGIFILGNLMVLACLLHLSDILNSDNLTSIFWSLFFGLLGSSLVWVARPYWIQVLFVTILLWALIISLLYIWNGVSSEE